MQFFREIEFIRIYLFLLFGVFVCSAPSCANAGVLGVIPGIIGVLQALEVLKYVGKFGETHIQRLLMLDGLGGVFRTMKLRPRQVLVINENNTVYLLQ